jgi:CobQ-like glutamine amidotransferase family enzyme
MPAGAGTNYTNFGNGFTGVGLRDINLYQQSFSWSGGPIQRFETNKPAFTGEDYLGFEDFWNAGFAPPQFTDGFIGDIHVGYGNVGSGRVIGQFQIVGGTPIPEPAAALGGMTLLGTIILRRRRASA